MYTKVFAAAVQGIDALICTIEVSTSRGIKFFLVGLPDNAVKESHERINSAFHMYGLSMPSKQIVINMAPADVRKEGSAFDLPIAVGIMVVGGMISCSALEKYLIMGELGLDGSLFPIKGALPIAVKAMKEGFEGVILPAQNSAEAAVVNGIKVYGASSLKEVMEFLSGSGCLEPAPSTDTSILEREREYVQDFAYVKGQESVKRALEVSAAGGHNLIMVGPPGSGKSMMAQCLPSILPPLTPEESLETTKIHSVAGLTGKNALITTRPFRSPHHTISRVAFVGGGSNYPKPGEISLAHNGILFADELPEFNRSSLEVLRQPLEERHIRIDRANYNVEYPASFMFVASMNPCPCGYYNHPAKECVCNSIQIQRYLNRISGPLLDRIDLHIEIVPVPFEKISDSHREEPSAVIRERVIAARNIQKERFESTDGVYCNAQMSPLLIEKWAKPESDGVKMLRSAMQRFNLSARAYTRILKVARTIADLAGAEKVGADHIAEAIGYRTLDRNNWGK